MVVIVMCINYNTSLYFQFLEGLAYTIKELLSNQSNARPAMELVRKKMERLAKDASITLQH